MHTQQVLSVEVFERKFHVRYVSSAEVFVDRKGQHQVLSSVEVFERKKISIDSRYARRKDDLSPERREKIGGERDRSIYRSRSISIYGDHKFSEHKAGEQRWGSKNCRQVVNLPLQIHFQPKFERHPAHKDQNPRPTTIIYPTTSIYD